MTVRIYLQISILIEIFVHGVDGALCYSYVSGYSYCSGFCSGSYGYEYCTKYYYYYYYTYYYDYYYTYYTSSISVGAIVGIVIGCLVALGVLIGIIAAVCSACTKNSGQTGRVVHPTRGVAIVTNSNAQQNQNTYQTAGMNVNMPLVAAQPRPPGYYANALPQAN